VQVALLLFTQRRPKKPNNDKRVKRDVVYIVHIAYYIYSTSDINCLQDNGFDYYFTANCFDGPPFFWVTKDIYLTLAFLLRAAVVKFLTLSDTLKLLIGSSSSALSSNVTSIPSLKRKVT